jgi:hypothetical protein
MSKYDNNIKHDYKIIEKTTKVEHWILQMSNNMAI